MATVAGAVTVPLRANTSGFSAAMAAASKSLGGVGTSAEKAGSKFKNVGAAMAGVASAMVAMKVASASLSIFRKYEKSMVRVAAVTNATAKELKSLNEKTKEVATTTTYTATEVADGMQFMAMAGMSATQVLGGIQTAAELAMAANMDLATSTDILTNIMRGMNIETIDLNAAADVLTATMTQTNTNVQMLGEGMKYVAPLARSAGMSLEEVSAAMGLLGNAGIQSSMAGTVLRQALSKMANPTKAAAGLVKELGLSFTDASGKMLPFENILGQLERASLNTAEAMEIFGLRAGPGMLALIQAGAGEFKTLKENITGTGLTSVLAEKQMATLDGKINALNASTEELGKTVGRALAPMGKMFVDLGKSVVDSINDWSALRSEILAVTFAMTTMVGLFAAMKMGIAAIGGVVSIAVAPWLALAAAVAAAAAGFSYLVLATGGESVDQSTHAAGGPEAAGSSKNAAILRREVADVLIDIESGFEDMDKGEIRALAHQAELLGVAVDPLIRQFAGVAEEAKFLGPTIENIPTRIRKTREELDALSDASEEAAKKSKRYAAAVYEESDLMMGAVGNVIKGFGDLTAAINETSRAAAVSNLSEEDLLFGDSADLGSLAGAAAHSDEWAQREKDVDAAMAGADNNSGAVAGVGIAAAAMSGQNLGALIGGFFGPLGSAIGGLVDIIGATTSAYHKITTEILKLVGILGVFLSPLFEMLVPFLQIIIQGLGAVLLSLGPVIEVIGFVVGTVLVGVATIVASVLLGLAAAIMSVILGINDFLALLPNYSGFLSDSQRDAMIQNESDSLQTAANLWQQGGAMDQWVSGSSGTYDSEGGPLFDPSAFDANQDALGENTDAINTLTESVLNAPSGFKLSGYSFGASGGSSSQSSGGGSTSIYINEINSPDAVRTMLDDSNRRRSYEGGGAPLPA